MGWWTGNLNLSKKSNTSVGTNILIRQRFGVITLHLQAINRIKIIYSTKEIYLNLNPHLLIINKIIMDRYLTGPPIPYRSFEDEVF